MSKKQKSLPLAPIAKSAKEYFTPGSVIVEDRDTKQLRPMAKGDREEDLVGIAVLGDIFSFGIIIASRDGELLGDRVLQWGTIIVEIDKDERSAPNSPVFVRPDGRLTCLSDPAYIHWRRASFRGWPDKNGYINLHLDPEPRLS